MERFRVRGWHVGGSWLTSGCYALAQQGRFQGTYGCGDRVCPSCRSSSRVRASPRFVCSSNIEHWMMISATAVAGFRVAHTMAPLPCNDASSVVQ